jgi:hypothetical protein
MNRLNADLKRLLKRAGQTSQLQSEEAPFGFASRVVAAWNPARTSTPLFELQQIAWLSVGVSTVVILCAIAILLSQPRVPESAAGLTSAIQFLASNFTP